MVCDPRFESISFGKSELLFSFFTQASVDDFYPNVTHYVRVFAIANPFVCHLTVTFVHPTQGVETFGNISSPFCILAILL